MEKYDKYRKITRKVIIILLVMDFIVTLFYPFPTNSFSIVFIGGMIYFFIPEYAKYKIGRAPFPKLFFTLTVIIIGLGSYDMARNFMDYFL